MVVTLRDVARHAGVSVSTASNVLHARTGRNSTGTASKVFEAVRVLGYRPSSEVVSTFARTRTIALVAPGFGENTQVSRYDAPILQGILEEAGASRCAVLILQSAHQDFGGLELDGVIVANAFQPELDLAPIARIVSPVVCLGLQPSETHVHWIGIDYEDGARVACEYLIELGHRRIAVLGQHPCRSEEIRLGAAMALASHGLPSCQPAPCRLGTLPANETADWIQSVPPDERPTGVLCLEDGYAIDLIRELGARQILTPSNISIVGFGDTAAARKSDPPLTTVAPPKRAVGRRAVRLVTSILSGRPITAKPEVLPCRLVKRRTVAPVRNTEQ